LGKLRAKKHRPLSVKPSNTQQFPRGLKAAQVLDGEWAVLSSNNRKPLTEAEANRIIAAYLAVSELMKSTF
jgi:hypothetical protein